jgi:hypothetical protein
MFQPSARNAGDPATTDFRPFWPGGDVVNWVALDGYYYTPTDTFESRFGQSIREVEQFWGGPIIIGETGVSPATNHQAADITDLFAGVAKYGLLGMIYYNLPPACPPFCSFYHPDTRLDNAPAALAAYRAAVSSAW